MSTQGTMPDHRDHSGTQPPTLAAHPDHHAVMPQPHAGHGGHGPTPDGAYDTARRGSGAHAGHDVAMFRRRFWWSLLLGLPVVATSHMIMEWFGYSMTGPWVPWVGPMLGSVIFLWGGLPFLAGALAEVRSRRPGMMTLIAMAISVAYVASLATSLNLLNLDFWWELAALIVVMLLGHWQEMRALGQSQNALAALAALLPDEAEVVRGDSTHTVPAAHLREGDVVLVRSGARVPADGDIVSGSAELDEAMITGESRPVPKTAGDHVVAGTVSTDSAIHVRVTAVGAGTALAGIQRLVAEAQDSRSRAQALADRAAALLFYVATAAAAVTFVAWSALGDPDEAIVRVVTVLVISCPHALGLAIPLVTSLSSAIGARHGILIKDRIALEESRRVDTVLFDKTGTLTRGEHVLAGVRATNGSTDEEVLRVAGAVESQSEHPLARAIYSAAAAAGAVPAVESFRSMTGRGVRAVVDGTAYDVGGPALLRDQGVTVPEDLTAWASGWRARGSTVLFLMRGRAVLGGLALEDEVRPEAKTAVTALQRMGLRVEMITGDAREVAAAVAAELGVDDFFAEVLPEDKDRIVASLQRAGHRVAMVGDGVNDAPALARAEVGIAIGAGTDVAIESAGLILATSDPRAVVGIIRLSRAVYRKSLQNLVWAAGYNVLAIPLAGGALAWAGINLPPAVGAALMSGSTLVVALNAQLLRRIDLRARGRRGWLKGSA